LTAFSASALALGLPTKRASVLIWVALAVLALGIERPRSTLRSFATTWLPLFGALAAYDLLRGASDGKQAAAHTWPQLDIDQWLGGSQTPTEHLQAWLWNPSAPQWWDYVAWGIYQSHFFVPLLLAVVLWSMRDTRAVPYVLGIAVLSWMALATYALYPAQPPWMTARDGLTGEVDRVVSHMWSDVGVDRAARVFSTDKGDGSRYSNPVAALPSLHAAFPMFIAVMMWGRRRWVDVLLGTYTAAMGFTLVYAGEHFTADIVLGWGYAVAVALAARRVQKSFVSRTLSPRPDPQETSDVGGSGSCERDRSRYTDLLQTEATRS